MMPARTLRGRALTLMLRVLAVVLLAYGVGAPTETPGQQPSRDLLSLSRAIAVAAGIGLLLGLIVAEWRRTSDAPGGPH